MMLLQINLYLSPEILTIFEDISEATSSILKYITSNLIIIYGTHVPL